ncbi:hypothetical protein ALC60_02735 [Trachymyrmex zeteki]|uniref:Uncharacterized protein n=1 Tax=Mycetomoellerius zeteki TaxID=64791 RepID=A0A151XD74_9HYME|nr:hypothetical protein ALC60_02735 [Trachymyrmex zeteki]
MAIAGAPTQPAGVCAPRQELKPPHYHGGPWRAAEDRILAKNTPEKAAGSAWRGSARRESLVRYDKYGNTLELKVRLSRRCTLLFCAAPGRFILRMRLELDGRRSDRYRAQRSFILGTHMYTHDT